jgi:hypothetical protein
MPARSPSRRDFLRLAALAPLAAAGCATVHASPSTPAAPPAAAPPATATPPAGPDPLLALRAVPLAASVEPALVFRALGGRGRCS